MTQLAVADQHHLPTTLDRIESAIALAANPEEINKVLALMDAAIAYAKRFYKDHQDIILRAKTLKLQAERRLGEILARMPKATGSAGTGRPNLGGTKVEPPKTETTLADIGIDKKTSSRAQKLFALAPERFAAVAAGEISVKEATAAPLKKKSAKSKARATIYHHKDVVANEGGTPLIVAMRGAFHAIESCGNQIEEQDKALVIARKLSASLTNFIAKFEGIAASL